jgi:hypothetical protein
VTRAWGWMPRPRPAPDDGDDLMRLARYRADHPRTEVRQGPGYWQAITPEGSGERIITRYELGELLDTLDSPDTS